ncbi:MAG: cbb3-type cytochrome c oxidase subunit I [Acidimicrobiales bacterium]|nr:cbb3-type cytochrome c oxidase subunit I [Acidimicrobiales bacterium]
MTVTEDASAAANAPAPATATSGHQAPAPAPGLAAILGSGDHKVIGRLWLVAAMVHLLLVGVVNALVAAERADTDSFEILGRDWIVQADTFRFIGVVFLVILPLTISIATAIVPLQVGASTVAFPRAASASAWTYLMGGGLLLGAYVIEGGPGGTDEDGVRLFVAAFVLVLLALTVAWICIMTTVMTLRAPGMGLARIPLFAWSALVAGGVWILTLPVLAGLSVLSYLDVRYEEALGGGPSAFYDHVSWAFGTPTVYALAIPVLGFVGSVLPVFARTRHHLHRIALGLIGAFAAFTIGSWTAPGFSAEAEGPAWLYEGLWVVVSIAAIVPVLGLVGLWALTARKGRVKLASPLIFGVAALLMLLAGLTAGALQAIEPIETLVDGEGSSLFGTSWSTGTFAYVALATIIALLGAIVYWSPKLLGAAFPEAGARLVALLALLGTVVASLPELVAGLLGEPAAATEVAADNQSTIETLNVVVAAGDGLLALAAVLFVMLLVKTATSDDDPGDDPWGGHTLEWATASPPPVGNFTEVPSVTSEAPLYDAHHRTEEASA